MEKLEFEILVFSSALDAYKLQVARCRRIKERAEADYYDSLDILRNMEHQLEQMRARYVARAA